MKRRPGPQPPRRRRERPATTRPRIRPVREADVEALVQLTLAAFPAVFRSFRRLLGPAVYRAIWPDWRAGQRRGVEALCRERDKYSVWVAELEGQPVGLIACDRKPVDGSARVQFLAVHPDHQDRGIGTALNLLALRQMKRRGVKLASVETGGDPSHAPARHAYEKAGFVPLPLVRYFKDL